MLFVFNVFCSFFTLDSYRCVLHYSSIQPAISCGAFKFRDFIHGLLYIRLGTDGSSQISWTWTAQTFISPLWQSCLVRFCSPIDWVRLKCVSVPRICWNIYRRNERRPLLDYLWKHFLIYVQRLLLDLTCIINKLLLEIRLGIKTCRIWLKKWILGLPRYWR